MTCCGGNAARGLSEAGGAEAQPASHRTPHSTTPRVLPWATLRHIRHSVLRYGSACRPNVHLAMRDRQREHKGGARSKLVLGPNLATVCLYNVPGNGQPQSRALLALLSMVGTLIKLVKDSCQIFCWDALA